MKPSRRAFGLLVFLLCAPGLLGQQTKSPKIAALFREVVAKPSQSTVRVLAQDKEVALGTIVSADGWILTKHSVLKGEGLACRLPDGTKVEAALHGFDVPFDLAMLKVEAKDLKPVEWIDSKVVGLGHWVASVGTSEKPVAIGIVSVLAREIKGAKFLAAGTPGGGYLGVTLDIEFAGVKLKEVQPNTPAQKAGLKSDDQILSVNGQKLEGADEFLAFMSRFKPNDVLDLKIERDEKESELKVTLGTRPDLKGGKSKGETQNSMGSKLSDRRSGFPVILQHDSVILPTDCGSPLVNLDGQVIGINISRAGRTESYAIPSEAVRPLLEKLKTAK